VLTTFAAFLARRRDGGHAVLCIDDAGVRSLLPMVEGPVVTYGTSPDADVRVLRGDAGAEVAVGGVRYPLTLEVPGEHNLLNAAAALATAVLLGAPVEAALDGLARFRGAARRFQVLGERDGVTVVDDYAHHPTELRATLAAARTTGAARVVCIVQPHRYSRTAVLGEELGRAAAGADLVVVTEVYGAGETAVPGVNGLLVARAAEAAGARVHFAPHLGAVAPLVAAECRSGDLVLVTGAGDVSQVGPALLGLLGASGGG
jgi:UDP-N-acetylmuramate--alanine ligase